MGAIRIRVQTADKNNSVIHTTPVHQLMPCEEKSCVLVRNKSIKAFLTSNHCPLSSVHNIVFSNEKVISSESGEKYAQITIYKKNSSKQMGRGILMWEDNRRWTFLLEEALLWIKDWHFGQKREFDVKMPWWIYYYFFFYLANFQKSKVNFTWCNSADLVLCSHRTHYCVQK